MPYFEEIDGYNMDVIKEEYRNVQILKKMLLRFRTEHLKQEQLRNEKIIFYKIKV